MNNSHFKVSDLCLNPTKTINHNLEELQKIQLKEKESYNKVINNFLSSVKTITNQCTESQNRSTLKVFAKFLNIIRNILRVFGFNKVDTGSFSSLKRLSTALQSFSEYLNSNNNQNLSQETTEAFAILTKQILKENSNSTLKKVTQQYFFKINALLKTLDSSLSIDTSEYQALKALGKIFDNDEIKIQDQNKKLVKKLLETLDYPSSHLQIDSMPNKLSEFKFSLDNFIQSLHAEQLNFSSQALKESLVISTNSVVETDLARVTNTQTVDTKKNEATTVLTEQLYYKHITVEKILSPKDIKAPGETCSAIEMVDCDLVDINTYGAQVIVNTANENILLTSPGGVTRGLFMKMESEKTIKSFITKTLDKLLTQQTPSKTNRQLDAVTQDTITIKDLNKTQIPLLETGECLLVSGNFLNDKINKNDKQHAIANTIAPKKILTKSANEQFTALYSAYYNILVEAYKNGFSTVSSTLLGTASYGCSIALSHKAMLLAEMRFNNILRSEGKNLINVLFVNPLSQIKMVFDHNQKAHEQYKNLTFNQLVKSIKKDIKEEQNTPFYQSI